MVVGEQVLRVAGVSTMPGLTQLTRMPCGAPSAASCLVSAMTPPLVTVWATRWLVIEPVSPAVDPTSTTLPPALLRCFQACLTGKKTTSSSWRSTKSHSSFVVSSSGENLVAPAFA